MYHHDGTQTRTFPCRVMFRSFVSFVFKFRIINPAKAMNELGWRPRHVGFLEEIDTYYKAWVAHKAAQQANK